MSEDDNLVRALSTAAKSDVELVEGLCARDERAFAGFYRAHAARVHRVALRLVGRPADADDITQRVFEKAWHALPRFRAEARLSTWLHRVTVNACLDHLRAAGRRPNGEELHPTLADPRPDPEMQVSSEQTSALVERAILRLPEKYRVVIVLRDIEGHSYKAMRAILRLPITTLKMRAVRGREQLARIVERLGVDHAPR